MYKRKEQRQWAIIQKWPSSKATVRKRGEAYVPYVETLSEERTTLAVFSQQTLKRNARNVFHNQAYDKGVRNGGTT